MNTFLYIASKSSHSIMLMYIFTSYTNPLAGVCALQRKSLQHQYFTNAGEKEQLS